MPVTKVKICGLARRGDVLQAVALGADFLGVVLVPGTPRARTAEEARVLLEGIVIPSVVVVADQGLRETVRAARVVGASVIQLHGDETPGLVRSLRNEGPWKVWKALRVRGSDDVVGGISSFGEVADGVLLDAWHPQRAGGTGSVFSWEEVAGVRDLVPGGLTLAVAGGLTPENVSAAVSCLRPDLVDVSSGVEERPAIKSPAKIEAFIKNVRWANGRVGT